MAIWNILLGFVKFYGHLEHFVIILYSFPTFGIMYLEKSGNPVSWPSNASDAAVEINNLENEIRRIDCLPPNVSMGAQMGLRKKIAQNVAQPIFCQNQCMNLTVE
jgi:hypothetical protein